MGNPRRNDIKCLSGVGGTGNKAEVMGLNIQNNPQTPSQATAAVGSSSGILYCFVCNYFYPIPRKSEYCQYWYNKSEYCQYWYNKTFYN